MDVYVVDYVVFADTANTVRHPFRLSFSPLSSPNPKPGFFFFILNYPFPAKLVYFGQI